MKTILVLENEPLVMKIMRQVLKQYEVLGTVTAEEAVRAFRERHNGIDLLVADLTLPISSGIQVALLLRSEKADLPVILTSGYPVSDWTGRDYSDFARLGSTSVVFLQKPFQLHALSNAVAAFIGSPQPEKARTA